jgi:hypothetical protein
MNHVPTALRVRRPSHDWQIRHNQALDEYRLEDTYTHSGEQVVLALAAAIDLLLATQWGTDGYVAPNVTTPMMQAFHDLLNIDLGRLDGGTLSSWLLSMAERYEIDGVL